MRRRTKSASPTITRQCDFVSYTRRSHAYAELFTYIDDVTPYMWQMYSKTVQADEEWCESPSIFNVSMVPLTDCFVEGFCIPRMIKTQLLSTNESVPATHGIVAFVTRTRATRVIPNLCVTIRPVFDMTQLQEYKEAGSVTVPYVSNVLIRMYFKDPGWAIASDYHPELNARDAACSGLFHQIRRAVSINIGVTMRNFFDAHDKDRCWVYVLEQLPHQIRDKRPPRLWCIGSLGTTEIKFDSMAATSVSERGPVFDACCEWKAPFSVMTIPSFATLLESHNLPDTVYGMSMLMDRYGGPQMDTLATDIPCHGVLIINQNSGHMALMQSFEHRMWTPFNFGLETRSLAFFRFISQMAMLDAIDDERFKDVQISIRACVKHMCDFIELSAELVSVIIDCVQSVIGDLHGNMLPSMNDLLHNVGAVGQLVIATLTQTSAFVTFDMHMTNCSLI